MDARVKIIYDGQEGDIINQYIIFCRVFKEQMKKYSHTYKAVMETIRICKDRDVLSEYLQGRESEVVSIMMKLFDDEEILDMYVKSQRREAEEAVAKKNLEMLKKVVKKMLQEGRLEIGEVADFFPDFSDMDIKEIEKEVLQKI